MKKFILRLAVLGIVVAAGDFIVGKVCNYLLVHAKGGDTYLSNYVCNLSSEDCMIFGSSRAMHHYDPRILADSLGMSVYNCGKDGNGIILMYGRYLMISERKAPKLLIYEVTPSFDLSDKDNHTFLPLLRPYYDRNGIADIFVDVDPTERWKMLSQCYRNNSSLLQLVMDNIHPMQSDGIHGYRPLNITMPYEPEVNNTTGPYTYDPMKLEYLQKLVDACRSHGTQLIFAVSPEYKRVSDDYFQPVKDIAAANGIPYISHYADPTLNTVREYFKDSYHLNAAGAEAYTKVIAGELRGIIGGN